MIRTCVFQDSSWLNIEDVYDYSSDYIYFILKKNCRFLSSVPNLLSSNKFYCWHFFKRLTQNNETQAAYQPTPIINSRKRNSGNKSLDFYTTFRKIPKNIINAVIQSESTTNHKSPWLPQSFSESSSLPQHGFPLSKQNNDLANPSFYLFKSTSRKI